MLSPPFEKRSPPAAIPPCGGVTVQKHKPFRELVSYIQGVNL